MSVFWFFKHMESSWCTAKAIHLMTFIVQRVIVVVWVASRRRTSTSYHIWLRHRHRAPYWLRVMWAIHTTVWRPTVPYIRDVTAVCVCDATHTWQLHDSRCLTPCRARPFWPCAVRASTPIWIYLVRWAHRRCQLPLPFLLGLFHFQTNLRHSLMLYESFSESCRMRVFLCKTMCSEWISVVYGASRDNPTIARATIIGYQNIPNLLFCLLLVWAFGLAKWYAFRMNCAYTRSLWIADAGRHTRHTRYTQHTKRTSNIHVNWFSWRHSLCD